MGGQAECVETRAEQVASLGEAAGELAVRMKDFKHRVALSKVRLHSLFEKIVAASALDQATRDLETARARVETALARMGIKKGDRVAYCGVLGAYCQERIMGTEQLVHVPKGVSPELAGLVTPMANGIEWSLFEGQVKYNSTVLIQGPGQQGLSQTVICKQAGAALIIVTGTTKDAARLKVAKELGADYVIDVQKEDPLARIMEITGGKGVDVSLDCTAGAGAIPILLGIEALKRKGGIIVAQGEMSQFPNFPLEKFTVKFITMKSARGHSYRACELALEQIASKYLERALTQPLDDSAVCRVVMNTGSIGTFVSYSSIANKLASILFVGLSAPWFAWWPVALEMAGQPGAPGPARRSRATDKARKQK